MSFSYTNKSGPYDLFRSIDYLCVYLSFKGENATDGHSDRGVGIKTFLYQREIKLI